MQNTAKIVLHNSKYDLSLLKKILIDKGHKIIEGRYFTQIRSLLSGLEEEDIIANVIVFDESLNIEAREALSWVRRPF